MPEEQEQLKFWQKSWVMWVCLILFAPVGIVLCYLNRERHPKWKIICGIFLVLFLIGLASPKNNNTNTNTTTQTAQTAQTQDNKPVEKKEELAAKQETNNEKSTQKQEITLAMPICPRAGIGDSVENFKRAVPGRSTGDMTYDGKNGVGAVFVGDKVYQVTVLGRATVNGRHNDLSVKDYYPVDAVLVEDKGEDNDAAGSWRWWSLYHSDKLAESMPNSNGNFVIIQRLYDTGKVNFVISIGDSL